MVTTQRVLAAYGAIWIISIAVLVPTFTNDYAMSAIIVLIASSICFTIILLCYCQIYKITRRHHRQIRNQDSTSSMTQRRNRMFKIKKSSSTFLLVTVLLFASLFPGIAYIVTYIVLGYNGFVVWFFDISVALWFLTAPINPMVYFWRMTDLRRAVKTELKRCILRDNNVPVFENHLSSRIPSQITN